MPTAEIHLSLEALAQVKEDLTSGDASGAALDVAKATGVTPLASIAEEAAKDAAIGGVAAGAIAWVAAQLGLEDIVAAVVIDAAAEVGITVGAGASLGSTLGPIGAAVGAIIGVLVALVTIGGAKGANGFSSPNPWTDSDGITRPGSLLASEAQDYITDHPVIPLLQVHLAQDGGLKDAIGRALGPTFDWLPFYGALQRCYAFSGGEVGFHAGSPAYQAFVHFFTTLRSKGVPLEVVDGLIADYCDFIARVRAAGDTYLAGLPDGYALDPDSPAGSTNALVWHTHDLLAAQAFDGAVPHLDPGAGPEEAFGWAHSYGVRGGKGPWRSMSASPFYRDLWHALTTRARAAYATANVTGGFVIHPLPKVLHVGNLAAHVITLRPHPTAPKSSIAQAAPYAAGGGLGLLLLRSLPNILPRGRR